MYTELKVYQQIIAALKKYGIKHCVLSAGSRNVPFVHSVEKDSFFNCYSVVDERSAGYFALGLAQELNEPVVISCTSSTATCNYWPPVAEAFYQNVPIVILTSDRNPSMLGQWEDQMIDQVGMFDRHVKKSVNLPIINDEDDEYYAERLINEALLELNHNGKGPVHINIPMKSYNNSFNVKSLPEFKKIKRISKFDDEKIWNDYRIQLENYKKILVVCGQNSYVSDELNVEIKRFFHKFNCAVSIEYMSNINLEDGLNLNIVMDSRYTTTKKVSNYVPDLIISIGGNVFSGIKDQLRKFYKETKHWSIQENGMVCDMFKSLDTIFECSPEYFFKKINSLSKSNNDLMYYNNLKEYVNSVVYPEFEYSHIYAIKKVVETIPENSILHLSINDSIRITNFFKLPKNIKVYANIGTHGIDGCLSSFLGQAAAHPEKPAFLIIGDLAYFYDMNATRLNNIGKNVHILMINNEGGSEFYFNKMWKDEYSDVHTTARHKNIAKGWVETNNFEYLSAYDKDSFDSNYLNFMKNNSDKPIFFEVFTEMKRDSEIIYEFFDLSRPRDIKSETIRKSKELIKKTIGQEKAEKIAKKFNIKK